MEHLQIMIVNPTYLHFTLIIQDYSPQNILGASAFLPDPKNLRPIYPKDGGMPGGATAYAALGCVFESPQKRYL